MENGVLFQYFEWNLPDDGQLWEQLARDAEHLRGQGVTAVWIPPAYKAKEPGDVGYAPYDLYDMGEFDQKGAVRTKYGTRAQLENAIAALHGQRIQVVLDVVLNHRMGGDRTERFEAVPVAGDDRNRETGKPREVEAYTAFDFAGRGDRYSDFKWHWYHFSGIDYDNLTGKTGIMRIVGPGKGWSQGVDTENGNYDFLMGMDVDVDNPEVCDELRRWALWAIGEFGFDGFRMDALKHIDCNFSRDLFAHVRREIGKDFFFVSEYWSEDLDTLSDFIGKTESQTSLFDVPLHFNFHRASTAGSGFDMSTLLDGSLVSVNPQKAVTFVDNHDSQPGSALETNVGDWFKPLAYALILLMEGGYPSIFYGDYYSLCEVGTDDDSGRKASPHRVIIDILLDARRRYAWGEQTLLFDHPSVVGLVRSGDGDYPGSGLVLLLSNDTDGVKDVTLGTDRAGQTWCELTGSIADPVLVDAEGHAAFPVKGRNVAVWVQGDFMPDAT